MGLVLGAAMVITPELEVFLSSPVMIIVGTCDGSLVPEIGRAVGAFVRSGHDQVDIVLSRRQWPQTIENVQTNGLLSATFARPSDYVSYQVKGTATVAISSPEQAKRARRYIDRMMATLAELGLEESVMASWFDDQDLITLGLAARDVFVQTPGAHAGHEVAR